MTVKHLVVHGTASRISGAGRESVRGHSYFLLFPLSLSLPPRSFLFPFIPRTLTYFPFVPFPSHFLSAHSLRIRASSGDSEVFPHFGLARTRSDSLGLVYTLRGSSGLPLPLSPTSLLFALPSPGRWHDSGTFPFHFIITCPLVPCDIRSDLWLVYCTVIPSFLPRYYSIYFAS
jgi:hypothetical protein